MQPQEIVTAVAILLGGFFAGVINALAGGGSLITLPLLILCGVPPKVANGTNRIAILAQCVAATFAFRRHNVKVIGASLELMPTMIVGTVIGAYTATILPTRDFNIALGVCMLSMALIVAFKDPQPTAREDRPRPSTTRRVVLHASMLLMGLYAGFIQGGVGVFLLASLVLLGGFATVAANAVKMVLLIASSALSIAIFWSQNQIDWHTGLILAIGMAAGGWFGARLQVKHGTGWVRAAIVVAVVASCFKLFGFWW